MVQKRCAAKMCFNATCETPNIQFFSFPKMEIHAQIWAKACGKPELMNKSKASLKRYVLCAEHFEDRWFMDPKTKTTLIKTTVPIPTIFRNNLKEYISRQTNLSITKSITNNRDAIEDTKNVVFDAIEDANDDNKLEEISRTECFLPQISDINTIEDSKKSVFVESCNADITQKDLKKFCRLCALCVEVNKLCSIYDDYLDEKINTILPLQLEVYKDDGLPQEICKSCIEKVMLCYNLIQQFVNANYKLIMHRNKEAEEQDNEQFLTMNLSSQDLLFSETEFAQNNFSTRTNSLSQSEDSVYYNVLDLTESNMEIKDTKVDRADFIKDTEHNYTLSATCTSEQESIPDNYNEKNAENVNSHLIESREVDIKKMPARRFKYFDNFNVNTKKEMTLLKCSTSDEEFPDEKSILDHDRRVHVPDGTEHEIQRIIVRKEVNDKKRKIKRYKCLDCASVFCTRRAYHTHLKIHVSGSYACDYCRKYFLRERALITHKRLHLNKTMYYCKICGKSFLFGNSYKRHRRIHSNINDEKELDTYDNNIFLTTSLEHEKEIHPEYEAVCKLCGKMLVSIQELKTHLVTHVGDKGNYPCKICIKTCKTKSALYRHNKIHREERNFQCAHCPKSFRIKSLLKQHMCSHSGMRPYVCDICGASYNRRGNMGQHRKTHFIMENGKQRLVEEVIRCNICRKRVTSLLMLKYHLAKHNGEKKAYVCTVCDKRFSTGSQLKVHEFLHTGERPYICFVCGKGFRTEATMKQHYLALHTDECPHECPFCDRKFKRLQSLIVHKRTHTGERPYPCPICGRAFAQKGDMMKHTNIHNQNKKKYAKLKSNRVNVQSTDKEEIQFEMPTSEEITILEIEDDGTSDEFFIAITEQELEDTFNDVKSITFVK